MDPQTLFNEKLPATLQTMPDKAKEIGAIYQFKISGEGGGEWTVDLAGTPPSCVAGNPEGKVPQCTIEITSEDFKAMLANPALGMQLFFTGKLKVTGDPMLATKLQKLFQMG